MHGRGPAPSPSGASALGRGRPWPGLRQQADVLSRGAPAPKISFRASARCSCPVSYSPPLPVPCVIHVFLASAAPGHVLLPDRSPSGSRLRYPGPQPRGVAPGCSHLHCAHLWHGRSALNRGHVRKSGPGVPGRRRARASRGRQPGGYDAGLPPCRANARVAEGARVALARSHLDPRRRGRAVGCLAQWSRRSPRPRRHGPAGRSTCR